MIELIHHHIVSGKVGGEGVVAERGEKSLPGKAVNTRNTKFLEMINQPIKKFKIHFRSKIENTWRIHRLPNIDENRGILCRAYKCLKRLRETHGFFKVKLRNIGEPLIFFVGKSFQASRASWKLRLVNAIAARFSAILLPSVAGNSKLTDTSLTRTLIKSSKRSLKTLKKASPSQYVPIHQQNTTEAAGECFSR